ncbi:hypothetical protein ALC57_07758, partial [Trachymyrmex cornetzi]
IAQEEMVGRQRNFGESLERYNQRAITLPSLRIRLSYLSKIHFWVPGEDYAYLSRNCDRGPDSASSSITSEPAHGRSAEVPYWLFTIGQAEHYATVLNPGMPPVEMPLNKEDYRLHTYTQIKKFMICTFSFARAVNSIHSEREWCLGALQTVIARKRRKQKTVEDA